MSKYIYITLLSFLITNTLLAQETNIPFGSDEYHLLDRMETRSGALSNELFMNVQPVSRKSAVDFLFNEKTNFYNSGISNVDFYNINRAISISGEWKEQGDGAIDSKHALFHTFYVKQPDFIHVNRNNFFLVINPILGIEGIYDKDGGPRKSLFNTTQGAEMRGRITDWFGFYFSATHNYEEPVSYIDDWITKYHAIPGAGKYNVSGDGYDYWKFRGYVNVALIPQHISLSLGYDQHFLGDGYRSLFLSDFSEGAAFASINTKIWKLNYQNIYMMLKPQSDMAGDMTTTGHKYATAHFLSYNATHWLNIGLFESVTFSRSGGYELSYMNPIIFYRAIERANGSPDKVAIGFSSKAIIAKHVQLYTQFLINEFSIKQLFKGDGYWSNKWGLQLGAKYFNAFGIPNLDLQAEGNVMRPYTYQHYANTGNLSLANYSSYNQALANPLGAGYAEVIGMVNYQPLPKWTIGAKAMFYKQGVDTNGSNNGSNILLDYQTRSADFGVGMIHGPASTCVSFNLHTSYELRPRLYLDLSGTYRKFSVEDDLISGQKNLFFSAGIRLNLARKDYTQF